MSLFRFSSYAPVSPGKPFPPKAQQVAKLSLRYIDINLSVCVSPILNRQAKESNYQGIKVQVMRAFQSLSFLRPKKVIKMQAICMKFTSTSDTSVEQVHQPPYPVASSFSKNISTPRSVSTKLQTNKP